MPNKRFNPTLCRERVQVVINGQLRGTTRVNLGVRRLGMVRTVREQRPDQSAMMREIVKVLQTEPRYALAVRRIDAIERRYLESTPTAERLGLQQSAARMALIAATDKDASYSALARRYLARTALGFRSVESELAVIMDFAFACADIGKRNAGLGALSQAEQTINKAGVKRRSRSVKLYVGLIAKCRSQLDQRNVKVTK